MNLNSNMPEFLYDLLIKQYGEENTNKIIEGYKAKRNTTLRVNTIKTNTEKIKDELIKEKIEFEEVSWSKDALIIKNVGEADLQKLYMYESGEIYLQSLSSMLPPIILNPKEKENILDMAAAPGGKTTQIAALTNNESFITACEMNKIRSERLKYNIEKQGAKGILVMLTDSRKMDDFFMFDRILLDAPCSGSGTIDLNNSDMKKIFTMNLINKSISSQITMLKKALKVLKRGKEMVYSTCSILECENEEIVRKAIQGLNVEIVPIEFKGIEDIPTLPTKIEGTICVCPNELYEGFFVAKIRKK